MSRCVECGAQATVLAKLSTSVGLQKAEFCTPCMGRVWKNFKGAVSRGDIVLSFEPVELEK